MPKVDMTYGGVPDRVGKGSKGISSIKSGVPSSGPEKAKGSSGYPGYQDSTPSESDKTQSAS